MTLLLSNLLMFAQDQPAAKPGTDFTWFLLPAMLIFLVFYVLILRPGQKKQERERLALVNNMNKNDKVITNAGIIGIVHSIQDDEVVLKLEDSAKMRILKSTIFRNVTAEERKAEASTTTATPKPEEVVKETK